MACLLQRAGKLPVQFGYASMHAWYGTTQEQPATKAPICKAALQECVVRHSVWPQACFLQLSKPALSSARSKVYTKAMQTWIDQATFA